jgi:hypothetical protein
MENPVNLFSFLIILVFSFLMALRIQAYLMKRAVSKVIDRFRENNSRCSRGSKTIDQLELQPPALWERLIKPRDYKPYALQMLIRSGVVRLTDDNKMCLQEKKLQQIQPDF